MKGHYTYFDNIIPQVEHALDGSIIGREFAADYQKLLLGAGVAFLFLVVGRFIVHSRLGSGVSHNGKTNAGASGEGTIDSPYASHIVPRREITFFGFLDFLMETFVQYHDSVAGKENRKHVPFTACIFFLVFLLNLLGLIPGMPASTTTVWINVAIALVVFVHFNFYGVKEHGLWGYIKHFLGPLPVLAPLMIVIEAFSLSMRVLTLNLRLYWNISADHMVLGIFSELLKNTYILAAPFYIVGLFVAFMQAFVFATLTMVYITLATQHEEGH